MAKTLLKAIAWLLGIAVLAVAALFAVNATDEALSEDAQAVLRISPPPPASEANGFFDFLALGAPAEAPTYATGLQQLAAYREQKNRTVAGALPIVAIDPGIPRCKRGEFLSCVAGAPARPPLGELIESHRAFLERYRAMRGKPEFIDLIAADASPDHVVPAYQGLIGGSRLSLLRAATYFNAGEPARAIDELEAEFAFYRKVAAGSRTLLPKMIAFAMLDGAAIFAAELARRLPAGEKALWGRLEALTRAPTKQELDLTAALNLEIAQTAGWMRTRRHLRLPDSSYETLKSFGEIDSRPWWDPVAPWLYRPHYSVNRYVAQARVMQGVAALPSTEFLGALSTHQARARAFQASGPARWIVSPAGHENYYLRQYDQSRYVGRMHAHAGVQSLAALQVRLRAAGIAAATDVRRALEGPLGSAHRDPFTGKPFTFDPQSMSLGFACDPQYLSAVARDLADPSGPLRLPL